MPYIRGRQLVEGRWSDVERLYGQGLTQKQIALRVGLAVSTVNQLLKKKEKAGKGTIDGS